MQGRRCFELKATLNEHVGANKVIEINRGVIYFNYILLAQTQGNVQFHIIPVKYGDYTLSGRRRHGTELLGSEDENGPGTLRVKMIFDKVQENIWHEAEIEFDFYSLGGDVFAMFGPRINEKSGVYGPGHVLLNGVRIYKYE
jgi:hypothetical protein